MYFPPVSLKATKLDHEAPVASWLGDYSRTEESCTAKPLEFRVANLSRLLSYKTWAFERQLPESCKQPGDEVDAVNNRPGRNCDQSEPLLTTPHEIRTAGAVARGEGTSKSMISNAGRPLRRRPAHCSPPNPWSSQAPGQDKLGIWEQMRLRLTSWVKPGQVTSLTEVSLPEPSRERKVK